MRTKIKQQPVQNYAHKNYVCKGVQVYWISGLAKFSTYPCTPSTSTLHKYLPSNLSTRKFPEEKLMKKGKKGGKVKKGRQKQTKGKTFRLSGGKSIKY